VHDAIECSLADMLAGQLRLPATVGHPVLVQVGDCPCMRYAILGFLAEIYWDMSNLHDIELETRFKHILYGKLLIVG
jgi:hypothetical protein